MTTERGINTHGMIVGFGKFQGELWTRVPLSYLRWMIGAGHSQSHIAEAELARRGSTDTPALDVTGHAVDRASTSCLELWQSTRAEGEGIHSWLGRVSREALDAGSPDKDGRCHYKGLRFVFDTSGVWPVLKTVMPARRSRWWPWKNGGREDYNAEG